MPFNGSGVYSPPGADFPVVTNTVISSTHFNNTINDIATGLTNCLTKDGQSTPTANIKLGGFKLTGLGAPTIAGDALVFGSAGTVTILNAAGYVTGGNSPLNPGGLGGNRWVIDSTVGQTRFFVYGTNAATNGSFVINSQRSDGTNATDFLSITTAGVLTLPIGIIDSGSAGSLLLRTNNGTTEVEVAHIGSGVNPIYLQGAATGGAPLIGIHGSDTNVGLTVSSQGTSTVSIATGLAVGSANPIAQFQVLHTASATRNITVTGSNGGNPTINTTAGSLAITPAIVAASTIVSSNTITGTAFILSGTVSATGVIRLANATSISFRNSGDTGDFSLIDSATVNSVVDVVRINTGALSSGVIIHGRSGGAAPNTTDLPSGMFTVWRDTGGATTKLYYNNAGAIQSVALA